MTKTRLLHQIYELLPGWMFLKGGVKVAFLPTPAELCLIPANFRPRGPRPGAAPGEGGIISASINSRIYWPFFFTNAMLLKLRQA